MIVNSFDRFDLVNAVGSNKPSFTIWFAGCGHKCAGCHNKALWDKDNGTHYTVDDIVDIISKLEYVPDDIVLLGGEPLEQPYDELLSLCKTLSKSYKVWLYTGYDAVPHYMVDELLPYLHFLKIGRYIQDNYDEGSVLGSANQRMFKRINDNLEEYTYENQHVIKTRI